MAFYDLLSTFSYIEGDKYRFVLNRDLTIRVRGYYLGKATFLDQKGKIRMTVNGDSVTIYNRYAWDGCSPCITIGDYFIGTPTPEPTVLASLVHDSLCQFLPTGCLKVDKKTIDYIFFSIMRQNGFSFSFLYYDAVRIFGGLYHWLGHWRKAYKCTCQEN